LAWGFTLMEIASALGISSSSVPRLLAELRAEVAVLQRLDELAGS
jgi:DNA-binding transcriptional regulator LsrR (DeoR family)